MQVTLSSSEITCDHCIATIEASVSATDGAHFVAGDATTRRFTVEVDSGSVLDRLASALTEAGYALGPVDAPAEQPHGDGLHPNLTPDWRPVAYRVERSEVGANVNYDCYCGCDAGFALDRSRTDQVAESCCCGNRIVVGLGAAERVRQGLESAAFRIDVQSVTMPWGQPLDVALAIPTSA